MQRCDVYRQRAEQAIASVSRQGVVQDMEIDPAAAEAKRKSTGEDLSDLDAVLLANCKDADSYSKVCGIIQSRDPAYSRWKKGRFESVPHPN